MRLVTRPWFCEPGDLYEIWRPVPGWNGVFIVSTAGRVKRTDNKRYRWTNCSDPIPFYKEVPIYLRPDRYLTVKLAAGYREERYSLANLMKLTFPELYEIEGEAYQVERLTEEEWGERQYRASQLTKLVNWSGKPCRPEDKSRKRFIKKKKKKRRRRCKKRVSKSSR